MKKLLFILATTAGLISCSKDKNEENWIVPITGVEKIKTVSYPSGTSTYTYDQYGRQVLESIDDGSRVESSYSKGQVLRKYINPAGVLTREITIEVGADGLRKMETFSDKPGNYIKYEYAAGKQLSKTISKIGADIFEAHHFYANGNQDSTQYFKNGVRYLTNVHTYYLDQPLKLTPANHGINYYTPTSTYMLKTHTNMPVNGNPKPELYTYEYDASGRMVKLVETTPNGTINGFYTYY